MEKTLRFKYRFSFILLALLILFHIVNNYFWLRADSTLGFGDASLHLSNSLRFYKYLVSAKGSPFTRIFHLFNCNIIIYWLWPGFLYLVTAGFRFVFGSSVLAVRLASSSFYFVVLIISVYSLGCYYRNARAGVISAFLVSVYPGIFGISRDYLLDFPLIAMVSLCMGLLLRTDKFRRRARSLIFGLSLGIGVLTKPQLIFFILPVAVYMSISGIKEGLACQHMPALAVRTLKNILFAGFTALISTSIWWYGFWNYDPGKTWPVTRAVLSSIFSTYSGKPVNLLEGRHAFPVVADGSLVTKLFTLSNWTYYLNAFLLYVTPVLAVIFVLGFSCLYRHRKLPKELLLWAIAPYFIFSVLSPKDARYIFPALPAIAVLSALGIEELKSQFIRRLIIILIVLIGIAHYFTYSYFGSDLFIRYSLRTKRSMRYTHPPFKSNYQSVIHRFMKEIEKRDSLNEVSIGVISPAGEFNHRGGYSVLTYYIESYEPSPQWRGSLRENFLIDYKRYNYLIVIDKLTAVWPDFSQLYARGYLDGSGRLMTQEEIAGIIDYFGTFQAIDDDTLEEGKRFRAFLLCHQE